MTTDLVLATQTKMFSFLILLKEATGRLSGPSSTVTLHGVLPRLVSAGVVSLAAVIKYEGDTGQKRHRVPAH